MRVVQDPKISNLLTAPPSWLLRCLMGFNRAIKALDNTQGIFGKAYYSGLPFRLGNGACKFGLMPKQDDPLQGKAVPCQWPGASMTGKEEEVTAKYAEAMISKIQGLSGKRADESFQWNFCVQVGKCCPSHSLAEGDVCWDRTVSPYLPVGTLTILPEAAQAGGIADHDMPPLYFNPWNQLKAHRPVGALNLARLHVYKKHCQARKRAGGGMQPDLVCPFLKSVGYEEV